MEQIRIKAIFFKEFNGVVTAQIKIPKGTTVNGFLSQPLDTLIFYSNSVCYSIPNITQYANIEIIE